MTDTINQYDIYVGKNVILTNWNGLKQHVKIVKNNKEKKYLEVANINSSNDIHFLTYKNIGSNCAITNIEIAK
jgi:hypothetical protein